MARSPDLSHLVKRCGCPPPDWATCPHPWHLRYAFGGREHRLSLQKEADVPGRPLTLKEAVKVRNRVIAEIEAGTRGAGPSARMTFGHVCDEYLKRYVRAPGRRKGAEYRMARHVEILRDSRVSNGNGRSVRLAELPLAGITKLHVEDWRERRRAEMAQRAEAVSAALAARVKADAAIVEAEAALAAAATPAATEAARAALTAAKAQRRAARVPRLRSGVKAGEVGINRILARWRHMHAWCVREGLRDDTPFRRGGLAVVSLNTKAETGRTRRLPREDEARLLAVAPAHLQAFIIGLLETGCRPGELLGLQWRAVDVAAGLIRLAAEDTKTAEARLVPITARLAAVLDMRHSALANLVEDEAEPVRAARLAACYVFGDEVGRRVASVKTAWRTACRRAGLANVHPHDLRREFASRLLETPAIGLHLVRDWLGHSNIKTTSRYLAATVPALQEAARRFEAARETAAEDSFGESRTNSRTARPAADDAAPAVEAGSLRLSVN
ncbi:MAG: site-specific integrase [Acidobacteria bacterium]|nr:site-specific integrase [Acidobacteriota bacterium]